MGGGLCGDRLSLRLGAVFPGGGGEDGEVVGHLG